MYKLGPESDLSDLLKVFEANDIFIFLMVV